MQARVAHLGRSIERRGRREPGRCPSQPKDLMDRGLQGRGTSAEVGRLLEELYAHSCTWGHPAAGSWRATTTTSGLGLELRSSTPSETTRLNSEPSTARGNCHTRRGAIHHQICTKSHLTLDADEHLKTLLDAVSEELVGALQAANRLENPSLNSSLKAYSGTVTERCDQAPNGQTLGRCKQESKVAGLADASL